MYKYKRDDISDKMWICGIRNGFAEIKGVSAALIGDTVLLVDGLSSSVMSSSSEIKSSTSKIKSPSQ